MANTVKMPEPACTVNVYEVNSIFWEAGHEQAGCGSSLFTEDQMKKYGDDREREALEKAAKVSDKFKQPSQTKATRVLAALISHDIRALAKEIK